MAFHLLESAYLCGMNIRRRDIRSLTLAEIQTYLVGIGEPKFRAQQIHDWLWKKGVSSFDEMLNVSKALRERLATDFELAKVEIASAQQSTDGTVKYGFRLAGGQLVEGVLIPSGDRITACISSQAGCSLSCKFCATGFLPMKHNLFAHEIYDQVMIIRNEAQRLYQRPLTNIVYMGMGEPLLNYRNVNRSIEMITSDEGLHMSPRRITVSTAGIAKMIKNLADDGFRAEFALSLHAANDEKRSKIMPINEHNSLEALADALRYFYEKTGTRVTYEYIIFKDFNDTVQDAEELAQFARIIPSKINIIEYNSIDGAEFRNTTQARMDAFVKHLESRRLIVNVRRSRGKDVDGACGQLAGKHAPLNQ